MDEFNDVGNFAKVAGDILMVVVIFGAITLLAFGIWLTCYQLLWKENKRKIQVIADGLHERFWSGDKLWQEAIVSASGYGKFAITMRRPFEYCTDFSLRDAERYEQAVLEKYNELFERRAEGRWYAGQRRKYGPLYDQLRHRAAVLNLAIYHCNRKVEVWQVLGLGEEHVEMSLFGKYGYTEGCVGDFLSDLEHAEAKRQRLVAELRYQPERVENFCQKVRFFRIETIQKEAEQKKKLQQKNERIM